MCIKPQKLKCLFGFHEYTVPRVCGIDEYNVGILMCCHCNRSGRHQSSMHPTWWFYYNEEGNLIHRKNSSGYEEWIIYNIEGHKIHEKDNNNRKTWYSYDHEGNKIHCKNSFGHEWWYDKTGKCIHHENLFV